jgi:hypothetical protein
MTESDPPLLVCQVGSTRLSYLLAAIEDLWAMLVAHGDWMPLGAADENQPAPEGSIEAWADHRTTRSAVGTGNARDGRGRACREVAA